MRHSVQNRNLLCKENTFHLISIFILYISKFKGCVYFSTFVFFSPNECKWGSIVNNFRIWSGSIFLCWNHRIYDALPVFHDHRHILLPSPADVCVWIHCPGPEIDPFWYVGRGVRPIGRFGKRHSSMDALGNSGMQPVLRTLELLLNSLRKKENLEKVISGEENVWLPWCHVLAFCPQTFFYSLNWSCTFISFNVSYEVSHTCIIHSP